MEVVAVVAAVVLIASVLVWIFRSHAASKAHTSEDRDRSGGHSPAEAGLFSPADAGAESQVAESTSRPDLLGGD